MRIVIILMLGFLLLFPSAMAMEQKWVDDLNKRFPNIGTEFQEAVQQKLTQHGGDLTIEELIQKLVSSPGYSAEKITDAKTFELHSELMLLYPAIGNYTQALAESKLLRDFVLKYPSDDPRVLLTFRGVYAELLIINAHYEEALRECEEMLAYDANEEGSYLSRGVVYVNLRQLDQAFDDLKILLQKPDPKNYAQQLFDFIMNHRQLFQTPQVQKNTLIDVMLRDIEPQHPSRIKIPANVKTEPQTIETPRAISQPREEMKPEFAPEENLQTAAQSLTQFMNLDDAKIAQLLGPPVSESKGEATIEREYNYNGNTLAIGFDQTQHKIISFQMFFLPPVDEVEAFARIGLIRRDLPPAVASNVLKVWKHYGKFSKVRLSINEHKVVAIIVEP